MIFDYTDFNLVFTATFRVHKTNQKQQRQVCDKTILSTSVRDMERLIGEFMNTKNRIALLAYKLIRWPEGQLDEHVTIILLLYVLIFEHATASLSTLCFSVC